MNEVQKAVAVEKSWLNPRWVTVQGEDRGPVDAFGAIPEPTMEQLSDLYEDTVYVCAKWSSDQVSAIPLRVYVKTLPGQHKPKCITAPILKSTSLDHLPNLDVEEVLDHPFKDIIDQPNPDMNRNEMLRIIDTDMSMTGNAYLYKQREHYDQREEQDFNEGMVEHLWPIASKHLEMAVDAKGKFVGFNDRRGNTPKFIPKDDVIWFKFTDPRNPYGPGVGPVRGMYERVLLGKAELAYLASLYRNQARPDSLVTITDITAAEKARVQKELNQRFRQGGIGGIWVENGEDVDIKPLSWSPKDVLGTEMYKYNKLQTENGFGFNDAIFSSESSNRAVADTAKRMAIENGILPRLRIYEEKINSDLAPEFDERLLVAFDNPVSEDVQEQLTEQMQLLDHNVIDIDEVRHDRGLQPKPPKDTPVSNDLRTTVGGLQAIAALQTQVYANQVPREAAIANVMLLFGFSDQEADSLFPNVELPKPQQAAMPPGNAPLPG